MLAALTRRGDGLAARSRQRWTGNHAARRVRGHLGHGPHSVAGALVVHSHAVGERVAHCVVGFAIVATNLLRLPTGFLRTEHSEQMYNLHIYYIHILHITYFPFLNYTNQQQTEPL